MEVERERLLALLERLRQDGVQIATESVQEGPAFGFSAEHPVALALADTAEAVIGKRPAFEMCPGLLETRWYARKGIPAFAYGPGFLEVSHGPNELVEIERIYQHVLIYALLAARLLA
jgi:acetylornithine deacetylase/succinyl-diaminopimelate desuccinylase-like protein